MDLGIQGRRAIVCGSSDGLGYACIAALAEAGVDVLMNGRSQDRLDDARLRLSRAVGREVPGVAADVTTEQGRTALFEAMPSPDILVTNAAGPPPGEYADWGEAEWLEAVRKNMIAPLMLIRMALPGMRARKWGRIVNITSAAVKAPMPMLGLSTGARSGLTGAVAGLAREAARDGVTINNLLPGFFRTGRLERLAEAQGRPRGLDAAAILAERASANPTGRIGDPAEFGAACGFLASRHAGYITAQNILVDGGAFPGTL